MQVDLASLAQPDIIETLDFEAILDTHKADLVARFPDIADTLDLESEPILKLLEVGAYRELMLRARYNDEARALLLAYAVATDLDHLGATYYQEARLIVAAVDNSTTPPTPAVMETHDDFRYRLSLKPESYSVAGPRDAYTFHALTADGQVKDARTTRRYAGTTEVFILARNGRGVPEDSLLATVAGALSDETIRPLSEEVIVSPGQIVEYALAIGLVLYPGASTELATAAAQTALASYSTSNHKLGRDIIKSAIDAAAHNAGVKEVIIVSPAANIVCADHQAPYCTAISVTLAGVES